MKKISYIICLTAILCSCNNELPIENVQELQTPKSKEDSEILSFKNSEEFLSTLNSSSKCNGIHINNLFKFFVWCEVSKSFTRSII